MNAPRTVSVRTVDHGVVDLPEPSWCLGIHSDDVHMADISHRGEELSASVDVPGYGRVPFLNAFLSQFPFSEFGNRGVTVAVEIEGEHHEFDPAGLGDVAAALTSHALFVLLPMRRQLRALLDEGQ
ncbi:DUF6907 domain-containing protein [Streptomyces sp. NPDC058646]|uniref:DUF6907 domain-containing protein n=1 Tax=Streptomyces sp. NPDC058646 TaxID=3346574 RepID=UPI00365FFA2B